MTRRDDIFERVKGVESEVGTGSDELHTVEITLHAVDDATGDYQGVIRRERHGRSIEGWTHEVIEDNYHAYVPERSIE